MRLSVRKKVLFPQPDGPMSAVTWPGAMSRFTPSRTFLVPNQQATFVAVKPAALWPGSSNEMSDDIFVELVELVSIDVMPIPFS
jgi:hypothetical protein